LPAENSSKLNSGWALYWPRALSAKAIIGIGRNSATTLPRTTVRGGIAFESGRRHRARREAGGEKGSAALARAEQVESPGEARPTR
jgi:hypothetical protein